MDRNSKIAKNVPKMFQDSRCLTETPRFLDEIPRFPIDRNSKISEIPKPKLDSKAVPYPSIARQIRRAEISRPPCLVRRMRNGGPCNSGPHRSGLAMASGPWLDEARPLIGHTSLSAAAAAVRTPVPLPSSTQQAPLEGRLATPGRGGPHTCSSAVSGGPSIALADLFAASAPPVLTLCVLCTAQCCTTIAVAN